MPNTCTSCTAFEGSRRVAAGAIPAVAGSVKDLIDRDPWAPVLVFDDATGERVEIDFRGSREDVIRRLTPEVTATEAAVTATASAHGPGRPKLGVVAREVTLLPRHWEWLNGQPGGASVSLRKLVEEARRSHGAADAIRHAQEACYRFLSTIAGDRPGYEEITRALFAGDRARFDALLAAWPDDVAEYARRLARNALGGTQDV